MQDDLLKKTEQHVQSDFMKSLATKCGFFFFSKEHVLAISKEILIYKDSETDKDLVASSLLLLVVSMVILMSFCWIILH